MDASVLTKKIGPLPVWAYGAGVGGLLLFLSRGKKGTVAGGDYAMQIPTNGAGNITSDTGGDGGTVPHLPPSYSNPPTGGFPVIDDPTFDITDPPLSSPVFGGGAITRGRPGTVLPALDPSQITKTDIPSIGSIPIAASPAAGAASGNSSKTFAASIANFAKSIGTPLAVVGNYFTADPTTKPSWSDPTKSNSVTVPGISGMTQAPTPADLIAKSQAQIAASPTLQNQIANANVQESQRKLAVVGEGGTLVFMDPKYASYFSK